MKKLKIFDAVEEVMNMDDLQLIQVRKHFNWAYLRKSLEELREYVDSHKMLDAGVSDLDEYYKEEEDNAKFLLDANEKMKDVKLGGGQF